MCPTACWSSWTHLQILPDRAPASSGCSHTRGATGHSSPPWLWGFWRTCCPNARRTSAPPFEEGLHRRGQIHNGSAGSGAADCWGADAAS